MKNYFQSSTLQSCPLCVPDQQYESDLNKKSNLLNYFYEKGKNKNHQVGKQTTRISFREKINNSEGCERSARKNEWSKRKTWNLENRIQSTEREYLRQSELHMSVLL